MSETIKTKFDPKSLPEWAQKYPTIVEMARNSLEFRCRVFDAQTPELKRLLILEAERWENQ